MGVFDGVHLGHFVVLRRVVERAEALGADPVMVTFAGHPKEVLLGRAPQTVTSLEHRLLLFERAGIKTALVLEFNAELRALTAEAFVRRVLLEGLGLRELVIGAWSIDGIGVLLDVLLESLHRRGGIAALNRRFRATVVRGRLRRDVSIRWTTGRPQKHGR